MSVVGHALVVAALARSLQLDRRAQDPRPAQARALHRLIRKSARTAFGQVHRFSEVRSVEDFRDRVPMFTYGDMRPWLERAMSGEPDVSWPGRMPYFAWSSGTTGGNKHLPISLDQVREQQRTGFDPIALHLRQTRDATLLDGPALVLGSTATLERRPGGVLVGENTGIMTHHIPRIVRGRWLPSPAIRDMTNWDQKLEAIATTYASADVRVVVGIPAWFPTLFDLVMEKARGMGRAVRTIHDVWPNLKLLTGGGINYQPYRALVESRLERPVPYLGTYNATEGGIMGAHDRAGDDAMLLLPDNGVFYELVRLDDFLANRPRRICLWQAEVGVTYVLLVSTSSGLFSYAIGDAIRFTGTFPHRFLFEGRTAGWLNVRGELTSQAELERAVEKACAAQGVELAEFTVAADVGVDGSGAARHLFLLELAGPGADAATLARIIDLDLAELNGNYAGHRESRGGLAPPIVRVLPRGTFHAWQRARGKLGGQAKVPRVLSRQEDRELLETVADRVSAP